MIDSYYARRPNGWVQLRTACKRRVWRTASPLPAACGPHLARATSRRFRADLLIETTEHWLLFDVWEHSTAEERSEHAALALYVFVGHRGRTLPSLTLTLTLTLAFALALALAHTHTTL